MSVLNAETLHVQEFIAHRVPRPKKDASGTASPVFSEAIPPLPTSTLDFFTKRFRRTLNGSGQPVEVDPDLTPTVPNLMSAYLSGSADLIEVSKEVASHLFTTQPASRFEEESIFVATKLTVMGQLGIGVMKLERESGLDLDLDTIDGKPTLTVTLHENLMLTDNTRGSRQAPSG